MSTRQDTTSTRLFRRVCKRISAGSLALLTGALIATSAGYSAAEEVRTLKELNTLLQPGPFIDTGSDGHLTQLPSETPELISRGKSIYKKNCAVCHGSKLEGEPNWNRPSASGLPKAPPHDKSGHTWHHADDQLFEYVKYGPAVALGDLDYRTPMPAFGSVLDDDEILSVLVYIRSSWPEKERAMQAATNDDRSGR